MSMEQEHVVTPDRTSHVLLYAMLKWYAKHREYEHLPLAPDVVILSALREQEGPLQCYPQQRVSSHASNLKEKGLVEKVEYYDHNLGWRLTGEGVDVLEVMGVPKQYDH